MIEDESSSDSDLEVSNEHHEWFKRCAWPEVLLALLDQDSDDFRKYKERDEHGRLPHHWLAAKAQTHTHTLAFVGVQSIDYNLQALTTRDKEGKTPLDIARRSEACAEIIGLLSLTPEEALSLGWKGMARLYAPVAYWLVEMLDWIQSRSYADCHKFFNEHNDKLVREVLKFDNSYLLQEVACNSQEYSDSLVFLALRMIHRNPLSLTDKNVQGHTALQFAQDPEFDACQEIQQILSLDPTHITSTPFPTLLLHSLPAKYHDIYGPYNTVCQFLRRTVSPHNKAELGEQSKVEHPDGEHLAMRILYDLNHNMSLGYAIGGQILSFLKPDPS